MAQAHVTLHGTKYPIVGPGEFDLGELNDCENFFNATFNDEEINSRKLSAILYVSAKRVDPSVTPKDIRSLTPEDLASINEELTRWQAEEDDGSPPAEGLEEPSSSENGSSNSVELPPVRVLSPTGDRTSDTSSDSAPQTFAS